jgi:Flp pilus assembly protein TadG
MPWFSANAVLGCARDLSHRWRGDSRGIAAVEFAFIVPIMLVMFIGAVELSQAITVDRRVTQVASSTADLVARKETSINNGEITDILRIGGFILAPFDQSPLQVVVRNVTSSSKDATVTK